MSTVVKLSRQNPKERPIDFHKVTEGGFFLGRFWGHTCCGEVKGMRKLRNVRRGTDPLRVPNGGCCGSFTRGSCPPCSLPKEVKRHSKLPHDSLAISRVFPLGWD